MDHAEQTPRIRVGIVGTGGIAEYAHLPALRELEDRAEIVGVMDIDDDRARSFAERNGISGAYTSLAALITERHPDIVHVCTPPSTHLPLAEEALRAGVWVLIEKPPALTLSDMDRIAAAEEQGGARASIVFQHRFGSAGRHAAELLRTGELGRPLVAVCNTLWYRSQSYFDLPWRGNWDTEGGGPTMGHGIHQMDLLLALLGPWASIDAVAQRLDRDVETEDASFAIVRFENGAVASIVNSILSPREESYVRIDTSDATVEVTHVYGYSNASWRYTPAPHVTDADRIERWRSPGSDEESGHLLQIRSVIDAFLAGRRPPMSGPDARQTLELIAGLYASAFLGRRVERDELVPGFPFYQRMRGEDLGALSPAARARQSEATS